MAIHDFSSQRLYVSFPLSTGAEFACSDEQANYLLNVLRLATGHRILVFNGRDGEWEASLIVAGKRKAVLRISTCVRGQNTGPDVDYIFAPLKRSRLDYMVQKAVELGAARLCPVLTQRTIAERVNLERMRANVIEAAEQCGVLRIPEVREPQRLQVVLENWDSIRHLIFCDEGADVRNPIDALRTSLFPNGSGRPGRGTLPLALLVGPEGGFSQDERELLLSKSFVIPISLGPRIMRADTAAVAALAVLNAVAGDW